MRISVMQPYFFPYAGYFRLMAASDIFVVFDCVQHQRRGRIHRNQFTLSSGISDWLSLPLAKAPQQTRIDQLRFAEDSLETFQARMSRFPAVRKSCELYDLALPIPSIDVATWLTQQLAWISEALRLECRIVRSSELAISPELRAEDRILEICKRYSATTYTNTPGGSALYEPQRFRDRGVSLAFLPPYRGSFQSVIERMLDQSYNSIRDEIFGNLQ